MPTQPYACPRCGAWTSGTDVTKHDRDHDEQDKLARRLDVLEQAPAGSDIEVQAWPHEGTDPR